MTTIGSNSLIVSWSARNPVYAIITSGKVPEEFIVYFLCLLFCFRSVFFYLFLLFVIYKDFVN